jgi:putative transposase
MDQRAAEASYGIAAQDLAPAISWTLPALRKAWNQAKDQVAPWWGENSKEAYNTGLDALARALGNWDESRTGKRKGPKIGFPRFKSRRKSTPTVRFTTGVIRVEPGRRHVTLPRLGTIRTHENTRKLQRRLAGGTARILSATVRRDRGGRWHVAFQAEVGRAAATPARPGPGWTWASSTWLSSEPGPAGTMSWTTPATSRTPWAGSAGPAGCCRGGPGPSSTTR